jgi:hypothetical protein
LISSKKGRTNTARTQGKSLWVHIAYRKQDEGKIACQLTSNVPLERGIDLFDMKVYASGEGRVYEQFTLLPGGTIHIDVYKNVGESSGVSADFKVTDPAVEVVKSYEIDVSASSVEE